jgi:hypothetical protein
MRLACGAVIEAPGSAFYTQLGVDGLLVAGGAYRWSRRPARPLPGGGGRRAHVQRLLATAAGMQ